MTRVLATLMALFLTGLAWLGSGPVHGDPISRSDKPAQITGTVLGDGMPLSSAVITARRLSDSQRRSAATTLKGLFKIDNLSEGRYEVTVSARAFVQPEPVQRLLVRPGDDLTIHLIRGGVITGTVTDRRGEPLVATEVAVVRVRTADGRRVFESAVSRRTTDDRGIYRAYGLRPGKYLVFARTDRIGFANVGFATVYHPSGNRDGAAMVEVAAGQEVSGIDIRFEERTGLSASGSITTPANWTRRNVGVYLISLRDGGIISSTDAYPPDAGFTFRGLSDGEYYVVARAWAMGVSQYLSEPRKISLRGADVSGLQLVLKPLASLGGEVRIEAPGTERSDCPSYRPTSMDEITVEPRLDARPEMRELLAPLVAGPLTASPDPDGKFSFSDLEGAGYRLIVDAGPAHYVKAVVRAARGPDGREVDLSATGIELKAGEQFEGLLARVSWGAALVEGKVLGAESVGPGRLRACLVPSDPSAAENVLRFHEMVVAPNGAFRFKGVAPGKYFIFARAVDETAAEDPDRRPTAWDPEGRKELLRLARSIGTPVEFSRCEIVRELPVVFTRPTVPPARNR